MLPTDRFPLITEKGYKRLKRLEEHPHAPRYTHPGYNRLTTKGLERAAAFASEIESSPPGWVHSATPHWVSQFVTDCYRDVPIYRRVGPPPDSFFDIPPTDRSDLNREPWAFVPDSESLDDLIIYNTSGTTGHPLSILTHADTLGLYIPLLRAALRRYGDDVKFDPARVPIAYLCFQKQTYTYCTTSPLLGDAPFIKINLNPDDWRDPDDRAKFLDDCNPQIYTGTPIAFAELAKLPLTARPQALISTSMTLTPGVWQMLRDRFDCPVLDVYSMNESGPIATGRYRSPSQLYFLLQPRLYIEILDTEGAPCPPGTLGEITLTGGFNPFLPLLRYRTGDYAAVEFFGVKGGPYDMPQILNLEGRPPVVFRAVDGRPINNVDVSNALRPYAIAQFNLHQFADGSLRLRLRGAAVDEDTIRDGVLSLFGKGHALTIESIATIEKSLQYTSEIEWRS